MDRKIFFYGIYAALIVISGNVAFFIQLYRTGTIIGGSSQPIDQVQAGVQLCVFTAASVLAFLTIKNKKFLKYFLNSLIGILLWYFVFEVLTLGWIREFSFPRIIASALYIILPTVYILKNQDRGSRGQSC